MTLSWNQAAFISTIANCVLGEKHKNSWCLLIQFHPVNDCQFLIEQLVYRTLLSQLSLGAQRALPIHSEPHSVCADVIQPSDTNHLISYISLLRDIQIWGPGLLLPFWQSRAVDLKCWHWLRDIIPLLNLSFFTSKTQITALIHPQCLHAYAHAPRLKASPISIRSPSFVRLDRAVGKGKKKKKT